MSNLMKYVVYSIKIQYQLIKDYNSGLLETIRQILWKINSDEEIEEVEDEEGET